MQANMAQLKEQLRRSEGIKARLKAARVSHPHPTPPHPMIGQDRTRQAPYLSLSLRSQTSGSAALHPLSPPCRSSRPFQKA
jgi:hypothetical protein